MHGRKHPWLTLLRLPNLLTVPGDPLAGALLAAAASEGRPVAWHTAAPVAGACLCLYAAGLLGNDYFDRDEDARMRSERPIPSGAVRPRTVLAAAIALTAAAIVLSLPAGTAGIAAVGALSLAVWIYNAGAKRHALAGPVVMGSCRGLSLIAGVASQAPCALLAARPLLAVLGLTLLVTAITIISRRETDAAPRIGFKLAFPPAALLFTLVPLNLLRWEGFTPSYPAGANGFLLLTTAMAVVWPALWCGLLAGRPSAALVRNSVGALIRGIVLLQAALCAGNGIPGELVALALLFAFLLSTWVGKWFSGS